MDAPVLLEILLFAGLVVFLVPMIARWNRKPIGKTPAVHMDGVGYEPEPENRLVKPIARFMELPPSRERILTFSLPNGRGIRLVDYLERPLTLELDGTWTAGEKEAARALLQAEVEARPDLTRLANPEDPLKGVVFQSKNHFTASSLVYRLRTRQPTRRFVCCVPSPISPSTFESASSGPYAAHEIARWARESDLRPGRLTRRTQRLSGTGGTLKCPCFKPQRTQFLGAFQGQNQTAPG